MQFTSILAEHLHNIIVEWKPSLLLQPLQGDYFKSDTKISSALRLSHLAFRYLCLWCGLHSFRLAQSRVGRTSSKLIVLCLLCRHRGGRTVTAKGVPFLPESEAPHCRRSIERKLDSRLAFFHHRRSQFWTCRSVCFQVGLDQRNGGKWFNTHTHTVTRPGISARSSQWTGMPPYQYTKPFQCWSCWSRLATTYSKTRLRFTGHLKPVSHPLMVYLHKQCL